MCAQNPYGKEKWSMATPLPSRGCFVSPPLSEEHTHPLALKTRGERAEQVPRTWQGEGYSGHWLPVEQGAHTQAHCVRGEVPAAVRSVHATLQSIYLVSPGPGTQRPGSERCSPLPWQKFLKPCTLFPLKKILKFKGKLVYFQVAPIL